MLIIRYFKPERRKECSSIDFLSYLCTAFTTEVLSLPSGIWREWGGRKAVIITLQKYEIC